MVEAANIAVGIVGILHGYFLVLEMFLWNTAYGRRVFRLDPTFAAASRALAANQGLYNGFLAAGLGFGLALPDRPATIFFLICVILAGLFGAATARRKILFAQALPGAVALALVLLAG